ncbi:MAG: hypothetical protein V5A84_03090, partial [Planctomycetota bacterium]
LSNTRVTGDALSHLKGLQSLEYLSLGRANIGNQGLSHLKKLRNLEILYLNETDISNQGLSYLSELSNLQVLPLEGTKVTEAGLAHLDGLENLQTLGLPSMSSSTAIVRLKARRVRKKLESDPAAKEAVEELRRRLLEVPPWPSGRTPGGKLQLERITATLKDVPFTDYSLKVLHWLEILYCAEPPEDDPDMTRLYLLNKLIFDLPRWHTLYSNGENIDLYYDSYDNMLHFERGLAHRVKDGQFQVDMLYPFTRTSDGTLKLEHYGWEWGPRPPYVQFEYYRKHFERRQTDKP